MATKDSTACPVLENAAGFQIWQLRIVGKLRREKVYDVLKQPKPDPSTTTLSTIYPSSAPHIDSWDVRDAKAHGIITDHICDRLVLATADELTAASLYNKLVDIHQNQNVGASAFYTFIGMLETKWDGSPDTVQDHIATIAAGDSKLVAMKKPMDSEFLAFLLLHSLPNDPVWEMFKTSVLNAIPKDEKITFSGISDRLVFNAMRQQGTETALKATKQFNKSKGSRSDAASSKSKMYCSFHKINGHDTKD